MADDGDIAKALVDDAMAEALQQRLQRPAASESHEECTSCGDTIPEQRRALGGIERCTACQTALENLEKQRYG